MGERFDLLGFLAIWEKEKRNTGLAGERTENAKPSNAKER
jgi:hypothetical protein